MRLILDTQVVYLWMVDDEALPTRVRSALGDARNHATISAVSYWEIAIKQAKQRLEWPPDGFDLLLHSSFATLPITPAHAIAAGRLPQRHSDPFDRVLIAQAVTEGLTIVGSDAVFAAYGVPVLWG